MLNITHYQRNANQNHNEVAPHPSQNAFYQKNPQTDIGGDVEKRESSYTIGENVNWCCCY